MPVTRQVALAGEEGGGEGHTHRRLGGGHGAGQAGRSRDGCGSPRRVPGSGHGSTLHGHSALVRQPCGPAALRAHLGRHGLREWRQPDGGESQPRNLLGARGHVVEPAAAVLPAAGGGAAGRAGRVSMGRAGQREAGQQTDPPCFRNPCAPAGWVRGLSSPAHLSQLKPCSSTSSPVPSGRTAALSSGLRLRGTMFWATSGGAACVRGGRGEQGFVEQGGTHATRLLQLLSRVRQEAGCGHPLKQERWCRGEVAHAGGPAGCACGPGGSCADGAAAAGALPPTAPLRPPSRGRTCTTAGACCCWISRTRLSTSTDSCRPPAGAAAAAERAARRAYSSSVTDASSRCTAASLSRRAATASWRGGGAGGGGVGRGRAGMG